MSRIARIVAPGLPHHVTQRGNRRAQIFFTDEDYLTYLARLKYDTERWGLSILAYCLMPNHMHHVSVPLTAEALGFAIRDTHTAYAVYRHHLDATSGHVLQGRFYSCVLDEPHLWAAIRYVERNPVRAGLVTIASDYHWSSAAAHCSLRTDPLLTPLPNQQEAVLDWEAWLSAEDEQTDTLLRQQTHTGRPLGSQKFLEELEANLNRSVIPKKRGPKPNHT